MTNASYSLVELTVIINRTEGATDGLLPVSAGDFSFPRRPDRLGGVFGVRLVDCSTGVYFRFRPSWASSGSTMSCSMGLRDRRFLTGFDFRGLSGFTPDSSTSGGHS